MVEIRITYETLFDLLRREKNREELQELDEDFYEQVLAYLKEKEAILNRKEDTSYFSAEKEKMKIQFQNIRRLVKELYERREKKVINIALVKARTGSDVIDTSALLPCELEFFSEMVDLFAKYKGDILDSVIHLKEFNGVMKKIGENRRLKAISDEEVSYEAEDPEESDSGYASPTVHFNKPSVAAGKRDSNPQAVQAMQEKDSIVKKIKIVEYLPKFLGRQGQILGPYEKDTFVELDATIADLLVKKGRAELA
ncbi:DNA replication complex GINS family protein [Candidatus Woesearchaeota archaeon]|nr:DNA replication complex GINS family protein [Candidatus Woesearchaeota archaeon]